MAFVDSYNILRVMNTQDLSVAFARGFLKAANSANNLVGNNTGNAGRPAGMTNLAPQSTTTGVPNMHAGMTTPSVPAVPSPGASQPSMSSMGTPKPQPTVKMPGVRSPYNFTGGF